jgi:DNA-binding transcriptional ArsR family regulator
LRISDPLLRDRIARALEDTDSSRILHSIRAVPKNAEVIATEVGVPLSSLYRKLAILRGAGLIFVRSFEITDEGKRQELFLSAVTEVKLIVSGERLEIELIPTEENASRAWLKLFNGSSGPGARPQSTANGDFP